jgi:hypothetical protein
MIWRPYRRIRQLERQVDTLVQVRETLHRVIRDERGRDLTKVVDMMASLHNGLIEARRELAGYDEALLALGAKQQRLSAS